jgi:hypothetical protein
VNNGSENFVPQIDVYLNFIATEITEERMDVFLADG